MPLPPRKRAVLHATEVTARTSSNAKPNNAILATASCNCGGPGGRPGMQPICLACARWTRHMAGIAARQAQWARCA